MRHHFTYFRPTWAALAASALVAACGGGSAGAPAGTEDTTPPTVAITDNVSEANATADITFTFTFNEAVSGFTTDDVTVTGGQKGAFSMASNNQSATLVVTPTANSTGTVQVNVAAGSFIDLADNASTAAASASQAFDTTTPAPPVVNLLTNGNFESGAASWTGNAANVQTEGGNSYNFADVAAAGNPWDANLSQVVDIPTQGVRYKLTFTASSNRTRVLKAGIGLNQEPFTNASEDVTLTTTPQTFELTLTANFAGANSRVLFDMGHDTGHVVIDNVVLEVVEDDAPVTPGEVLTFSSGFTSNVLTASGGHIASAGGSDLDSYNCNGTAEWCGSDAGGSGADSFMYFYYQTPTAAAALYSQIELFAPNIDGLSTTEDTGGVTINGQTKVNFMFNPNGEWFDSGSPRLGVVLTLGKRYAIGNGCHIELIASTPITSAASTAYSLNLANDFRVAQDCGTGIAPDNVAAALTASPVISSVKFLGAGGNSAVIGRNDTRSTANLSVANGAGLFPTTVALKGAITFD